MNRGAKILNGAVLVAALGYFVDIYDLLLFGIVRTDSLRALGFEGQANRDAGEYLIGIQMYGMLAGGLFWGLLGDARGRLSVLFGSILTYSLANVANGMVESLEAYAAWRFIAGVGLAGELGAGITLVAESLPKEKRGLGTLLVAAIGLSGAIAANLVYKLTGDWRLCYYAGGGLGMLLLLLRVGVSESTLFKQRPSHATLGGGLATILGSRTHLLRYIRCVLIGIPLWFVVGVLITFAPEFASVLGVVNAASITAGEAIAWCYGGLVLGDVATGLLSQRWRSRKKVMWAFLSLSLLSVYGYLLSRGLEVWQFYLLCAFIGFAVGYWVIFVTIAAEQFGTNVRATVTTTVPNLVRGSLPIILIAYQWVRDETMNGDILMAAALIATVLTAISMAALWGLRETFSAELDYHEHRG